MNTLPFSAQAPCLSVSVTSTASTSAALPGQGNSVRLCNEGPNNAYFSFGTTTQTATVPTSTAAATCTPVLAGTDVTLSIPTGSTLNFSAITKTAGETATVRIQVGEGV